MHGRDWTFKQFHSSHNRADHHLPNLVRVFIHRHIYTTCFSLWKETMFPHITFTKQFELMNNSWTRARGVPTRTNISLKRPQCCSEWSQSSLKNRVIKLTFELLFDMPGDDINSGIFTNLSDLITVMEPHTVPPLSPLVSLLWAQSNCNCTQWLWYDVIIDLCG